VPVLPDHPISSRRRYDRFGTSPSLPKSLETPHYGEYALESAMRWDPGAAGWYSSPSV